MHCGQSAHTVEHELFTPQVADLKRVQESGSKERQLPKLNVAGSIPVSRSKESTRYNETIKPLLHFCSDYMT